MRLSTTFLALLSLTILTTVTAIPRMQVQEKRKNVNRPDPANLDHCPGKSPGDADRCTFESQQKGKDQRINSIVGTPLENCHGGKEDITTKVGGSVTVSQTWKWGVSIGFSADGGEELPIGVSFQNSDTWTNTKNQTFSQKITMTIPPGQKGAVVAQVLHHTFLGRIRLNYGDPSGDPGKDDYHYIWYHNGVGNAQPTDDVIYGQQVVSCDKSLT